MGAGAGAGAGEFAWLFGAVIECFSAIILLALISSLFSSINILKKMS